MCGSELRSPRALIEHLRVETNPHYRTNIIVGLGKLTSFLADAGIIEDHDNRWPDLGLTN